MGKNNHISTSACSTQGHIIQALLYVVSYALSLMLPAAAANQILLEHQDKPPFTHDFSDSLLERGTELVISGINTSDEPEILVVRIDNSESSDYYSRSNREFTVAPGTFTLTMPLTSLKTSGNEPLAQPYDDMRIFAAAFWSDIKLNRVLISTNNSVPKNTLALDFGSLASTVFPGFEPIQKDHPYIEGNVTERVRTSGDPLIHDGISGIEQLQIPWPDGEWKISLWAQDQGEWEYLPHYLDRNIRVNGVKISEQSSTATQWINDVYLAGRKQEAVIDGDLWSLVGERRSGFISGNFTVTDGLISLAFEGDFDGKYLSGLVVEPIEGTFGRSVQTKRRERFLNTWPIIAESYKISDSLVVKDVSRQVKASDDVYLTPGNTILNLEFEITSPTDDVAPVFAVSRPRNESGDTLFISERYGHWRFERPSPNGSSLVLNDSYLRADMETLRLSSQLPRRVYVQVHVPKGTKPGDYQGKVQLFSQGRLQVLDYQLKVLPFDLPTLQKPVGLYLEPAPYYHWFNHLAVYREKATACDLTLLSAHGFSTVAPSLVTPVDKEAQTLFIKQLQQLKQFGFTQSLLAYSPLKRLLQQQTPSEAEGSLVALKKQMKQQGFSNLYWSVFDEPLPDKHPQIKRWFELLNKPAMQMKTAGHMNNENQEALAEHTDLLLINHGINVSADTIDHLQEGRNVWLYNMPYPRLAAGFYLWRSGADGYLQWHGRMPTADPFDPTDGREDDVIYLYPSVEHCPKSPDIHRRFLDLHEATLDLRWLQWLEQEAKSSKAAAQFLQRIEERVDVDWKGAQEYISDDDLLTLRTMMTEFALSAIGSVVDNPESVTAEHLSTANSSKQIIKDTVAETTTQAFYVHAGRYKDKSQASSAIEKIDQLGFQSFNKTIVVEGQTYHHVMIGSKLSLNDVNRILHKLGRQLPIQIHFLQTPSL